MLEQHEVSDYLLARRLLSRRSIVARGLRIADISSRNRNLRVDIEPGRGYLLKQGLAADGAQTLANEAALYRRLTAGGGALADCAPRLHAYDAARGVLILEWVAGGEDLYRHHRARRRCSPTLAAALGRALAALHAIAPDDEQLHAIAPDDEPLRRDAPWVLSVHRPRLELLRHLSAPGVELIRTIQSDPPFARGLDELREGWRVEALVHRDVKWANCIAHPAPGAARRTRVKLVDWEMAGWGDPALDLGSAFGDYLGYGLRPPRGPELPGLRSATTALWRSYVRERGLDEPSAVLLLARATRFAGARLVQSAYEKAHEDPSATARIGDVLRLGRELLCEPVEAAAELLGVGP